LILLAKVGQLELLRIGECEVLLPEPVQNEIEAHGATDPVAEAISALPWLVVVPGPSIPDRIAAWKLATRESAVLAAALETSDVEVILDDLEARRCAGMLGLPVRGTLGLVLHGKAAGAIPTARPLLEELLRVGMYLTKEMMEQSLALIGE
jgi:predicted nucleic acid-binding protein